jgi:hypothetical protein
MFEPNKYVHPPPVNIPLQTIYALIVSSASKELVIHYEVFTSGSASGNDSGDSVEATKSEAFIHLTMPTVPVCFVHMHVSTSACV